MGIQSPFWRPPWLARPATRRSWPPSTPSGQSNNSLRPFFNTPGVYLRVGSLPSTRTPRGELWGPLTVVLVDGTGEIVGLAAYGALGCFVFERR